MKKEYQILILKLFLFVPIIIAMNFVYKTYFYEKDIQKNSEVINKVRMVVNDTSIIVYIGESSNIAVRGDDKDQRAISEMISDYFPSMKLGTITKEASHAGIYYELLRNIPESSSVKTIIVTMNLRSFNSQWIYSDLETPLQKSMVLIKDYPALFNRFLLSFKGYDIKSKREREKQFKTKWKNDKLIFPYPFKYKNVLEWDKAVFHEGIKNPDGTKNQELTELADSYVKTYAFQIDTLTNPRIKDFDNIVSLANKRNWHLVFNLMAENTERAKELIGDDLVYLIKQNRDLLVKRYNKNGVIVVDNLELIPDEQYIDRNWTTEHYAEKGRKTIAKNVADSLNQFYPNKH
jgi:hypothetical protein